MRIISTLAVLTSTALVGGCSGEPSESDVRAAIEQNGQMMMGLSMLFAGPRGAPGAEANARQFIRDAVIKIDGCKEAPNAPGFVCDFRMGKSGGGQMSPPMKGRFFESGDGWQFEQMQ